MARIQIITIIVSLLFLCYIARLIIKGKLREEYSIVWLACTVILLIFSFWRDGLAVMSNLFGVFEPPNLIFTACIFVIMVYLLHLSVVASNLHKQNKHIAQEMALLKQKLEALQKELSAE
jgi:hypothetical protein